MIVKRLFTLLQSFASSNIISGKPANLGSFFYMWLFHKSNRNLSSRRQIQIKEVKDNILILPHNEYRLIVETSSVNFELKSEAEQDVLIDNFQIFLNSLSTPIQILIRVREVDIDHYVEQIAKSKTVEKEKIYKEQIDTYCEFIQELVSGNKILSRKFYIVIPYTHTGPNKDFQLIKEQLFVSRDIVTRGMEKLGMKVRTLDSLEVLNLFYSFYNPSQVKTQELKPEIVKKVVHYTYV